MHTIRFSIAAILLIGALRPADAGDKPRPTTPEQRQRVVKIAHALEENPFAPNAAEDRAWVYNLAGNSSDIRTSLCLGLISSLLATEKPHSELLVMQWIVSTTAFVIEHPEQGSDDVAASTAGLKGLLRTYRNVLKVAKESRLEFLDDLATKSPEQLAAYVSEGLRKCNEGK